MSSEQNFNIDEKIKNIMDDALKNNNFSKLNQGIGRTVNDALNDFESLVLGKPRYRGLDIPGKPLAKESPAFKKPEEKNDKNPYKSEYGKKKSVPGSVSGILWMVFGLVGLGFFGIGWLSTAAVVAITGGKFFSMAVAGFYTPLFAISAIVAWKGNSIRKRVKRFHRYDSILNGRKYCDIKELSGPMGKPVHWIVKDLEKMIASGMFPYGCLDEQKKYLMLDNETYQQYLKAKKSSEEQQAFQEKEKRNKKSKFDSEKNESEAEREQRLTIEEGKNYILQIRKANDDIPGEEVSKKLDRLENVIENIFKHIETHPQQIPDIRKFMRYYLPTTLKLTAAYAKLDDHVMEGENISSAKSEIRKTLDTISMAFENLLDDLFYHEAMDISSEISVLETMFAQEGLTENDFKIKRKGNDDE